MLSALIDCMANARRPAVLVFFGDHRPSIPGVTSPFGPRETPYVIMRFSGDGTTTVGANCRVDLTPAELHHAALELICLGTDAASLRSAPQR
jgi:hypothetical protein